MDQNAELAKYKEAFQQSCIISESLSQINNELQEKLESLNAEHLKWQTENEQLKKENARRLAQQKQEMEIERQNLVDQLRIEQSKAIHRKDEEIKHLRGQLERIFEKTDSVSPEHQQKGHLNFLPTNSNTTHILKIFFIHFYIFKKQLIVRKLLNYKVKLKR